MCVALALATHKPSKLLFTLVPPPMQHGHRPTAREQWIPCPDPAPVPPPDAKLVAAADLPISVYVFYEQFLSVETTCLQDHHVAAGQTCFKASRCEERAQLLLGNCATGNSAACRLRRLGAVWGCHIGHRWNVGVTHGYWTAL